MGVPPSGSRRAAGGARHALVVPQHEGVAEVVLFFCLMCIYIYIHIHTPMYIYIYIYIHTYIHLCMYIYIYIYTHICIYVHTPMYTYIYIYIYIHTSYVVCLFAYLFVCSFFACVAEVVLPTRPGHHHIMIVIMQSLNNINMYT